ncbi:MAG: hypothetical protein HQK50_19495 [Oligoflexia bacterium]|nr:hypothetical protein [Oligoflexia bacterium]
MSKEEKNENLIVLKLEHLPAIMKLQEEILASLPSSDLYAPFSSHDFSRALGEQDQGFSLGVFVAERLIAFACVLFPGEGEDNLGYDLAFPAEEIRRVAHLEEAFVHPLYRGQKWQQQLFGERRARIQAMGRYRHLCTTISPFNYYSIKNALAQGLVIKKLKRKYNNQWRFILHQDLQMGHVLPVPSSLTKVVVDQRKKLEETRLALLLEQGSIATEVSRDDDHYTFTLLGKHR